MLISHASLPVTRPDTRQCHQCVFLLLNRFSDLDEGEGWSGAKRLCFVLLLILDVLLRALLLVDLLLFLHVEEDPRRHSDGDGILWLWLRDDSFF